MTQGLPQHIIIPDPPSQEMYEQLCETAGDRARDYGNERIGHNPPEWAVEAVEQFAAEYHDTLYPDHLTPVNIAWASFVNGNLNPERGK